MTLGTHGAGRASRQAEVVAMLLQQPPHTFPEVLTSRDIIPLVGRTWFMSMLHKGCLPGVQVKGNGVWRCDRTTFFDWVQEVYRANPSLGITSTHGSRPPAA